jgi:hypothetical protein
MADKAGRDENGDKRKKRLAGSSPHAYGNRLPSSIPIAIQGKGNKFCDFAAQFSSSQTGCLSRLVCGWRGASKIEFGKSAQPHNLFPCFPI